MKRLRMRTKFEQPTQPSHLGESLARMLRPEFFAIADDVEAAMAAADAALANTSGMTPEQIERKRIDDRIYSLRTEIEALEAITREEATR
jgi:hypothetical protein